MKTLIVIDMQNDFIDGSLGTHEAQAIVPNVVNLINSHRGPIIVTQDTHPNYYLETLEGKKLPIIHCIKDTEGWDIHPMINKALELKSYGCIEKPTFGVDWENYDKALDIFKDTDEIIMCGLCTDICVVSNALILRAMYPNKKITVDASCCAGVTPEKHKAALEVMKSCQIDVINE